jgi:uncharacterized protein
MTNSAAIARVAAPCAAAVALFLLVPCAPASAQSFDCTRSAIPAEFEICHSFTLSGLDAEMSGLYNRIVNYATSARRSEIMVEQRDWLEARNQCGRDYDCLAGEYRARIKGLGTWWDVLGMSR